jgi:hypothetical protein
VSAPVVLWGSLRWRVLVWACSEPGEWTYRSMAADLGEDWVKVKHAVYALQQRGLLARGKTLRPTPDGERALQGGRHAEAG